MPGRSSAVNADTTCRAAASLVSCRMLPLVSTSTAIVSGLALSVWKDRIGRVSPLSRTSKSEALQRR